MDLVNLNKEVAERLKRHPKYNRYLVEIKESSIPNAGLGLFAKYDIPKDTIIDAYIGREMTAEQCYELDKHKEMYIMTINDNLFIDGGTEKNFISYTNDARGIVRTPGVRNNCRFELTDDNKMVLVASKKIKAGSELFVFYGDCYWRTIRYYIKHGILTH